MAMTIGEVRQALADDKILAILRAEDTDRTERRYEREAGRKEATAQAILTVLKVRQVIVGDAGRSRILACTDLATLDGWMHKAPRVSDIASLFADSGPGR